jgi:uncharacterized membrane protein (DUF106 family)
MLEEEAIVMIDLALQQDSQRRLREIKDDLRKAKANNNLKEVRELNKELQEEQKILTLIERVHVA